MAHGNQLGSALGGGNSGEAGDLKWVSFGIFGQRFQDFRGHFDEGAGLGFPLVRGLRGDVDHRGAAAFVVVGELGHRWPVVSVQWSEKSTSWWRKHRWIRDLYSRN